MTASGEMTVQPETLTTDDAAVALAKLGHPVRLRIVQYLVQAGDDGLSVGEIQSLVKIPASTLSHHISHLVSGGLIGKHRDSRTLNCIANYERLAGLVELLTDKCCAGIDVGDME